MFFRIIIAVAVFAAWFAPPAHGECLLTPAAALAGHPGPDAHASYHTVDGHKCWFEDGESKAKAHRPVASTIPLPRPSPVSRPATSAKPTATPPANSDERSFAYYYVAMFGGR